MTNIIDQNLGKVFSPIAVFFGYFFLIFGIILLYSNILLGLLLILFGGCVSLTRTGIEFDIAGQKFKEYTNIFYVKIGSWQPLDNYVFLTVLKSKITYKSHSRSNVSMTTSSEIYFDLFILTKSHRKKIRIGRHESKEEALIDARILSEKLGMQLVDYNPEVSAATKARR